MIYIVQDINGSICGVYDSLKEAAPVFAHVYNEGLEMIREAGVDMDEDDPFYDCDTVPEIQAWHVNGEVDEVFFTMQDVEEALGE